MAREIEDGRPVDVTQVELLVAAVRFVGITAIRLLADGPAAEILAERCYQGLGAQTGGRAMTGRAAPQHPAFAVRDHHGL
ncbi:hypothetical protein ACIHCM_10755 [Streptomyces sp. NPDC052023]|uniref:hypothetical protein n=1 Tax=Streptomyces sp. NPDC052023 TaxID=3365681 RepID=UPI0037CFE3EB